MGKSSAAAELISNVSDTHPDAVFETLPEAPRTAEDASPPHDTAEPADAAPEQSGAGSHDDFPGDRPSSSASAPASANNGAGEGGKSLASRVSDFKTRCESAKTTVKLQAYWNASTGLRSDLDAADPDELAELEGWWNDRFAAVEAQEKA
jgi:hypothetical protein